MPSFDTVLETDMVKVKNAVENAAKEIGTRFDFKGTSAAIELKEKDKEIILIGDSNFQIDQIQEILRNKLSKVKSPDKNKPDGVDPGFLDIGKIEKIGGDKVKQITKVRDGIETEQAKKIQQLIKGNKMKVQAAIQEGKVRVTGAKRDDLQAAMALIRKEISDLPLSFDNFRD
ncbi:MAG: YajQ family cyclic di-GMP-binding protein [Pseudomonadota bacterium]